MYTGRDFVVANFSDLNTYGFDFVHDMRAGDTIVTQSWSLATKNGNGQAPATLFVGTPWHLSATAVAQQISGLVAGTIYIVGCSVSTALGDTIVLWSHIRSEVVG